MSDLSESVVPANGVAVEKYLLVLLDECATSFCHYENPRSPSRTPSMMSLDVLRQVIAYSKATGRIPHLLLGDAGLPADYEVELACVEHIKLVPCTVKCYRDAILVVNPSDYRNPVTIADLPPCEIMVLRLARCDIGVLADVATTILGKCRRLNLSLLDVGAFDETDLAEYKKQLTLLAEYIARQLNGHTREVNVLTDRLMLRSMNNCEAGLAHITVAPDGSLYICPGFYHQDQARSVGHIDTGCGIPNRHLLELGNSPVCTLCDAYQCRRCVWLSRELTREVNVPSWQQCRLAHAERTASRYLISLIDWPIPAIDYDDPFHLAQAISAL